MFSADADANERGRTSLTAGDGGNACADQMAFWRCERDCAFSSCRPALSRKSRRQCAAIHHRRSGVAVNPGRDRQSDWRYPDTGSLPPPHRHAGGHRMAMIFVSPIKSPIPGASHDTRQGQHEKRGRSSEPRAAIYGFRRRSPASTLWRKREDGDPDESAWQIAGFPSDFLPAQQTWPKRINGAPNERSHNN